MSESTHVSAGLSITYIPWEGSKERRAPQKPKVVPSFLMTITNIHELPRAVELAREHEVNELMATNLDYPSKKTHETLMVFSCAEINQRYAALIAL